MKAKTSALQKAFANAEKKIKVHNVPKKKEPKGDAICSSDNYYYPPTLYLSEKDFANIETYQVGQKLQLAIAVEVTGINMREDGNDKRFNCDMKITEISDITPPKKGA